jgi:LysM repeat protein
VKKKNTPILILLLLNTYAISQDIKNTAELLELDTQYCFIQFHEKDAALRLKRAFDKTDQGRVVICHYGASHIQSEIVTTHASRLLKQKFGDAGPGFMFPFSAADTYDGINYKTSHTGKWAFSKSYQLPPKIPLGIRGMTVETMDSTASVSIKLKEKLVSNDYEITILYEPHDSIPAFQVQIDTTKKYFNSKTLSQSSLGKITINHQGEISTLQICWKKDSLQKSENQTLRLYGLNIEHKKKQGLIYHPMGVGASPFQAVLHLEKLTTHAQIIKPDIIIIDYGTNNILYTNEVPKDLDKMVEFAVTNFRKLNPEVTIILTSTQDLFYKKKYIDAAIHYNQKMDSLAAINHCLYWNFYDLSGGFKRIKYWNEKGYAKDDFIHLTQKGYELKGNLLYKSIINTLQFIDQNPEANRWSMPVCMYAELLLEKDKKDKPKFATDNKKVGKPKREDGKSPKKHVHIVKSGDTLSKIASRNNTTVNKIKKLNGLTSDKLKIGQKLRIK